MKKNNARMISLILVLVLAACIILMYIPSCNNSASRSDVKTPSQDTASDTASGTGSISIETQPSADSDTSAADDTSSASNPLAGMNKALSTLGLAYKTDMFGVAKPNFDAEAEKVNISKLDKFSTGEANAETMLIVPFYPDSKITVEKVKFDGVSIVPTETVFTSTSTEDYALSLTAARPAIMPDYRVSIEYQGATYSYLVKGEPGSEAEYIR